MKLKVIIVLLILYIFFNCYAKEDIDKIVDLKLKECVLSALKKGGDIKNISSLICKKKQIESIEGISILSNLKELDLSINRIIDLSDIRGLKKLEKMNLSNNFRKIINNPTVDSKGYRTVDIKTIDLKWISDLPNLKELILTKCYLTDVSGLSSESLNKLILDYNYIKEIKTVENISKLSEISLSYNLIEKADTILNLSALKVLSIVGNRVKNIILKESSNLQELYINGNYISDISFVKEMPNLRILEAANTCLRDVSKKTSVQKTVFKNMKTLDECKNPNFKESGWGVEELN